MLDKLLCEICKKKEYTRLCDHSVVIALPMTFYLKRSTCKKKMCDQCSVSIWHNCDVCPKHFDEVKIKISKVGESA